MVFILFLLFYCVTPRQNHPPPGPKRIHNSLLLFCCFIGPFSAVFICSHTLDTLIIICTTILLAINSCVQFPFGPFKWLIGKLMPLFAHFTLPNHHQHSLVYLLIVEESPNWVISRCWKEGGSFENRPGTRGSWTFPLLSVHKYNWLENSPKFTVQTLEWHSKIHYWGTWYANNLIY